MKKIINRKVKFFINEEKNKKDKDKVIQEYLFKLNEKEKENKEINYEKPEDISDYININEQENDNYKNLNDKITNEAIEEVEEAKEASELKQQSSEIYNNLSQSIKFKKNVKNFLFTILETKQIKQII